MTVPKINSAHGADTRNIINRSIEVLNRLGIDVQTLVAEGQLSPAQYADLITIVNGNIKSGDVDKYDLQKNLRDEIENKRNKSVPIGLNDLKDSLLSAIEGGEGTSFNLLSTPRPHSVKPTSTTFVRRGKNLFEGEYTNAVLNGATTYYYNPDDVSKVAIVEVDPNTSYAISKTTDTDRFRVAAFSGVPQHGDTTDNGTQSDGDSARYITTDATQDHLVIYVSSDGEEPSQLQVEEGNTVTEYEEPNSKVKINLHEDSFPPVDENMATFFQNSEKNLATGTYYDGYLNGNFPYTLERGSAKYTVVEVNPNTTYTASKSNDTNRFRFGQFDTMPGFGDAPTAYAQPDNSAYTFETGANTKYIVIVVTSTSENKIPEWLQVEEGTTATDYEATKVIQKKFIPTAKTAESEPVNYFVYGDLNARYKVLSTAPTMSSALDLQTVYDAFDNLVTNHPDYVSRELLIEEPGGLPIYLYRFTPPKVGNYTESLPKMLHINGIHGDEKQSLASGMRFYADLCDSWQGDELLKTLRWNVEFIVAPAFNAYGVENNTRRNSNDVDLNRQFPTGWTSGTYSGTEPLSEPEAQAIYDFMEQEQGIVFAIDHHRYNPFSQDGYTIWTGTKNSNVNKLLAGWSRRENAEFKVAHPELATGNESRVYVQESYAAGAGGWISFAFAEKGIPGTILEVSSDSSLNDYHTEAMAGLFGYAFKHLHNDISSFVSE